MKCSTVEILTELEYHALHHRKKGERASEAIEHEMKMGRELCIRQIFELEIYLIHKFPPLLALLA